jgi:hypothetical protein
MRLMAQVVFSGNYDYDIDGVTDALHDAGFEVHRMPAVHPELGHPDDNFLEVITQGPAGPPPNDCRYPVGKLLRAMMREVDEWAECFGGTCMECGPVEDDYVPFTATFHGWTPPPSAVILPFPSREGMK